MTTDAELARRGADNLARNHLRVAPGECVVVFHLHADEVLPTIVAALEAAGARAECVALGPWSAIVEDREFSRLVAERVRGIPATMYVGGIDGPSFPRSTLVVEALNAAGVRHLHVPGASLRMLATSLRADPTLIERVNARLIERLSTGRLLTVVSAAGTDLRVVLSRRFPLVGYHGVPTPGAWDSVPTGAVNFFSPDVTGTYVADRIARGAYLGKMPSDVSRTPLTMRFAANALEGYECADPAVVTELRDQVGRHPHAGHVGFVSFSTNYLARSELRVFAHDALLPGLRLVLGYSDQAKTRAPYTATTWSTFLGRKQTIAVDGVSLVRSGRLDPTWTSGILPF